MPLSLPNLDDRRYADLVEEARALIPSYAPEWTNHNPSDPGVTLVELFAYLTEMLLYRVNRVTDDNKRAFLKLILGPEHKFKPERPLGDEIRDMVLELRRTVRAVTVEDYERLAVAAHKDVARARALPLLNLKDDPDPFAPPLKVREGHVSVVVVPKGKDVPAILEAVRKDLEDRKLLTTRLHIVEARYVKLTVKAKLQLKPGALERTPVVKKPEAEGETPAKPAMGVTELAVDALKNFFDSLLGGPDGRGWPFGRSVYVSEVYALLDRLPGVDHVSELKLDLSVAPRAGQPAGDRGAARRKVQDEQVYAYTLEPDELVSVQVGAADIMAVRATFDKKYDTKQSDAQ
ncbi:MAG TPA: hypothetical protein VF297_06725 [Pyrinomonadaceae bacterium]